MAIRAILLGAAGAAVLWAAGAPGGAAQAQAFCPERYSVQPGDTLYGIARFCGIPVEVIVDANPGVNWNGLRIGQTVSIPQPIDGAPPLPPAPPPPREPPAPAEDRRSDARITVDRGPILAGGVATVRLTDFRRREEVVVRAGPERGRLLTQYEGRAPRNRETVVEIDIPRRAQPGERWIVEVEGDRGSFARAQFRIAEPEPEEEIVTVTGVLTNEGVECPTLRSRRGVVYSLAGRLQGFRPGDLVTVTGVLTDFSTCQQGETIEIEEIETAR